VKVVVTGGNGRLGREIMTGLRANGATATAASRRTGVDLSTGVGLRAALEDADVIVHAASHPTRYRKVVLDGARRIVKIINERPDTAHLVFVSVVGCDRNPYPYYRARWASEIALERSGLPVTVVRATQFHTLVESLARVFGRGPVSVQPRIAFQPCDHRWLAGEIVAIALGEPPPAYQRVTDLAGPEQIGLREAVELVRESEGKPPPRVFQLPVVGGTLTAYAWGTNLPDAQARIGGPSFTSWLRR
jgi:uncharacterized protein YbjT (DUF2867 family)